MDVLCNQNNEHFNKKVALHNAAKQVQSFVCGQLKLIGS